MATLLLSLILFAYALIALAVPKASYQSAASLSLPPQSPPNGVGEDTYCCCLSRTTGHEQRTTSFSLDAQRPASHSPLGTEAICEGGLGDGWSTLNGLSPICAIPVKSVAFYLPLLCTSLICAISFNLRISFLRVLCALCGERCSCQLAFVTPVTSRELLFNN